MTKLKRKKAILIWTWLGGFAAYNSARIWMSTPGRSMLWYFLSGLSQMTTPVNILLSAVIVLILHTALDKKRLN